MIISLDNLASRYGCLPSEALARGSTFDLRTMEIASLWEVRKQRLAEEPEAVEAEDQTRALGPDYLQAMIDNAKGDEDANS